MAACQGPWFLITASTHVGSLIGLKSCGGALLEGGSHTTAKTTLMYASHVNMHFEMHITAFRGLLEGDHVAANPATKILAPDLPHQEALEAWRP